MDNKEKIIKTGVTYLQDFNSLKTNTSHPMVYGSVVGSFLLFSMIVFFIYFNTAIAPGNNLFPTSAEEAFTRFPAGIVTSMFLIILFLACSFKLSLQGRKLSFIKALTVFFKVSKYNDDNLWENFWITKEKGKSFVEMLNNNIIMNDDFHSLNTRLIYQNFLFKSVEQIKYNEFEQLINLLYDEHCIDNKINAISKNKSAIFVDASKEDSPQAEKFKNIAFHSKLMFEFSAKTLFIGLPPTVIRIINAIPFAILFFYVYFFSTSLISWNTPEFKNQITLFQLVLDTSLIFGILYAIISFVFLRRTEEWRIYWKLHGINFLLQFHQQGESKVPPFFLPDTSFYNPHNYYDIFEACKDLPLSSTYMDKRNMFFDNSQYQCVKLFTILYHSYQISPMKKEVKLKENITKSFHKHESY